MQALWALRWLHDHGSERGMQPGWTYLFEAVYAKTTIVVPYLFEGSVLLSAVAPDGCEVGNLGERQQLAAQLGVMLVPCLQVGVALYCMHQSVVRVLALLSVLYFLASTKHE